MICLSFNYKALHLEKKKKKVLDYGYTLILHILHLPKDRRDFFFKVHLYLLVLSKKFHLTLVHQLSQGFCVYLNQIKLHCQIKNE